MAKNELRKKVGLALVILLLAAGFVIGCAQQTSGDSGSTGESMEDMEGEGMHEHEGDLPARIHNDGAVITIVSPPDGATFAMGEDVLIEVEIENFELNVDGSHWHVYVDGVSFGMVVGNTTQQVLRNLEPGEHMITAYLANGAHEELEEPGMIKITITQ